MLLLEYRDNFGEFLGKKIGAPGNQISLIITMLSVIPFCFLNYLIHGKTPRLIYSFVVGFLFQVSIYKYNTIHILISTLFTYLFIQFYGRKVTAYYVFIFSFIHLSYLHIRRLFDDFGGWTIDDPTTIYMMSICKFSSLAFSYEDGGKDESQLKNNHHKEYRIIEKPSLLEILSFIYFYPTAIVGPSIEYKDFINFIKETDCYSNLDKNLPYLLKNGLNYFLGSFVAMAYYAIMSNKLPVEELVKEEFGKHNLLYILAYIYFCIPGIRARYYSGWILSYSTLIFSGLSYTEKEKDGKIIKSLEKGCYGTITIVEWCINPKTILVEWNKTIHLWLKYNVYTRLINIERKPFKNNWALSSLLTFMASAIWHGYYWTYYFTFISIYFYQSGCLIFDKVGLYDWIYKTKFLIPLASVFNALVFETVGVLFFNIEWSKGLVGLKNMRYYPIFVCLGTFIISKLIKVPKKDDKSKKIIEKEKKVE